MRGEAVCWERSGLRGGCSSRCPGKRNSTTHTVRPDQINYCAFAGHSGEAVCCLGWEGGQGRTLCSRTRLGRRPPVRRAWRTTSSDRLRSAQCAQSARGARASDSGPLARLGRARSEIPEETGQHRASTIERGVGHRSRERGAQPEPAGLGCYSSHGLHNATTLCSNHTTVTY